MKTKELEDKFNGKILENGVCRTTMFSLFPPDWRTISAGLIRDVTGKAGNEPVL